MDKDNLMVHHDMTNSLEIFKSNGGFCWCCRAPDLLASDCSEDPACSTLELFENGKPLGPPHHPHSEIRELGEGRYSHWGGQIYFSTSDNSDPNTNGRTYQIRFEGGEAVLNTIKALLKFDLPAPLAPPRKIESPLYQDYVRLMRQQGAINAPVNLQNRTKDETERAAEYALGIALQTQELLTVHDIPRKGVFMEIGPGWEFGSALIVAEHFKQLIVSDLFLAPWQEQFHPAAYRALQRRLARPSPKLDTVIEQSSYDGVVTLINESACDMPSVASNSVDVIFSNAVLEHVHPLDKAAQEMFRITKPGGWGMHQVDFRYHRDFDKPLEYLLFTREEFEAVLERTHYEAGCQTRVREAADMFAAAGFEVTKIDVNKIAPADYMEDFMTRLRRSPKSPYKNWPAEDLAKISARLFLRKPAGAW